MQPKTATRDLLTTRDMVNHLHNEFVARVAQLKTDIQVCCYE